MSDTLICKQELHRPFAGVFLAGEFNRSLRIIVCPLIKCRCVFCGDTYGIGIRCKFLLSKLCLIRSLPHGIVFQFADHRRRADVGCIIAKLFGTAHRRITDQIDRGKTDDGGQHKSDHGKCDGINYHLLGNRRLVHIVISEMRYDRIIHKKCCYDQKYRTDDLI